MCCHQPDECMSIYGVDGCFTAAINKGKGLGLDLQGAPRAVHLLLKWPRQQLLRLHVCVMADGLKARGSGIKLASRVPTRPAPFQHFHLFCCSSSGSTGQSAQRHIRDEWKKKKNFLNPTGGKFVIEPLPAVSMRAKSLRAPLSPTHRETADQVLQQGRNPQ